MGYTIYGGELSLFTRKLEAACIFYGADFAILNKNQADVALIEQRAGTHQVPVLHTPENWMITDTTPLLAMLDGRFAGREMFPAGEQGLLVHMLEEHLDEWIARVMVHYRWHYADSARFAATRMAGGNTAIAERMLDWGPRACRATGTDSAQQQQAAEAEYLRLLEAAEQQLQATAFLLGDRPTALDCIVLGGLRAHTNMDPDPKKVVAAFPTVVHWAERRADQWDGSGDLAPWPESTPFARHVLSEMCDTYVPYVLANADAQAAGAKAFHAEIYGEQVSYLSRPYPEFSRQMVANRAAQLNSSLIRPWLSEYGLASVFAAY
ncbi:MAG: glutathione binding-like protein [Pseudomonadota bacterium]